MEGVAWTRGWGGGEDFVGEWPALYAEGGGKDAAGLWIMGDWRGCGVGWLGRRTGDDGIRFAGDWKPFIKCDEPGL